MFRTRFLIKYGIVRMNCSCQLQQVPVKWSSTSNNPSVKVGDAKANEPPTSTEPSWVKTALDKKIYSSSDVETLLSSVDHQKFDGRSAINVVNILTQWIAQGKFNVADFQNIKQKAKLEESLMKGDFNVGISTTLQALKSLQQLGFSPESKVIDSLETEILWLLRKVTIGQHFLIIGFHAQLSSPSSMQQKVLKETVANMQRRWVELVDPKDFASLFKHANCFSPQFIEKMEDVLVELVQSFSQEDLTKIITVLSSTQRRSTPLLRSIAYHLNKSTDKLSVRMASDILFSLQRLSFHDHLLMERVCNDLMTQLTPEAKSSSIGSIFTSLGQIKYRHESCLDVLCDWMNQNWAQVRHQDVLSMILCLAAIDFLPSNWKPLWEKISDLLKDGKLTSSLGKVVLLDLVWSLAVLNHLDPSLCKCVINDDFIRDIVGPSSTNSKGAQLKLNQIWALAVLKKWDLSGFRTTMPFSLEFSPIGNSKSTFNQTIINGLGNFLPPGKYLRVGGQTSLGIELDAECILNEKCVPFPIADHGAGSLPAGTSKVAVIILDYKDVCKGKQFSIGAQGLRERLLIQSGYRVVKLRYTDFDPKEKIVKKVQQIEQLIKNVLNNKAS